MSLAIGLGVAVSAAPAVAVGGGNLNLLLWTEAFDDATWVKTNASVVADSAAAPDESTTAEEVTNTTSAGAVRQVSTTAASSGSAATATPTLSGTWVRQSVSGTFDGLAYTFSVYLLDASGSVLRLRLDISGGFLRCSIEDTGDLTPYLVWGAQLEQAASASTYTKREGT